MGKQIRLLVIVFAKLCLDTMPASFITLNGRQNDSGADQHLTEIVPSPSKDGAVDRTGDRREDTVTVPFANNKDGGQTSHQSPHNIKSTGSFSVSLHAEHCLTNEMRIIKTTILKRAYGKVPPNSWTS